MLLPEPVPEPSAAPTATPSAVPSEAPSIEPSTEPSASPSAAPTPEPISSLEYATIYVLGENPDLGDYTEQEVALEDIMSVISTEEAPVVIVQLGEGAFAVITGYEADEDGNLTSLTLTDAEGDTILGGMQGILKAWVYVPAQPEVSAAPSGEPSVYKEEGINFYTQVRKDNPAAGEYPIKIDGYTADIAMMVEYYRVEDITPSMILAIDDQHTIGADRKMRTSKQGIWIRFCLTARLSRIITVWKNTKFSEDLICSSSADA